MTPVEFTIIIFAVSVAAGLIGSLVGIGGGIIVIPVLTLVFNVDIRTASGASIVAVIATSSSGAAKYVQTRMANLRVAMFLEMATTTGALIGATIAGVVNSRFLLILFGIVMAYSAIMVLRRRQEEYIEDPSEPTLAAKLKLHGSYFDESLNREVHYHVAHPMIGLALMVVAGAVSGLLGIGSGGLKVPAMDIAMRLPIKVSTATSNMMIGVTAAAGAGVWFSRGDINPFIAAPVAIGVMIGAAAGSQLLGRLENRLVRVMFVIVLIVVSIQMLLKGLQ